MFISRLDKVANTDRYVIYDESASTGQFAMFVGDLGLTHLPSEATRFRDEEAQKFIKNWEASNPGHLYALIDNGHFPTVEVCPTGEIAKLIRFSN